MSLLWNRPPGLSSGTARLAAWVARALAGAHKAATNRVVFNNFLTRVWIPQPGNFGRASFGRCGRAQAKAYATEAL